MLSELMHLLHLFFALLEAAEIILDEKRRVELAYRDVVVSCNEYKFRTLMQFYFKVAKRAN